MRKKEINEKPIIVKKERRFKVNISFKTLLYIVAFIFIIICIWIILSNKWIEIDLTESDDMRLSLFFSILVSLMLLMYLVACGIEFSYSKGWLKFIFLIAIILIIYYGYENVGLKFTFNRNLGLLTYEIYESNSGHGILFLIENWLFWLFVWIVSLMFMSND